MSGQCSRTPIVSGPTPPPPQATTLTLVPTPLGGSGYPKISNERSKNSFDASLFSGTRDSSKEHYQLRVGATLPRLFGHCTPMLADCSVSPCSCTPLQTYERTINKITAWSEISTNNGLNYPGSPHAPTHHTLFPTDEMPFSEFDNLFRGLPWNYGGTVRR